MIAVPKNKIESVVGPIIEGQAGQYGFTAKEVSGHMVKSLVACFDQKTMFSYVDSLENPTACLICGYSFSMMFPGTHVTGYLLWVSPEHRGTRKGLSNIKVMLQTLEDFAKMFNAKSVMVSSWLFGNEGTSTKKLWPKFGFKPMELVLAKEISQ